MPTVSVVVPVYKVEQYLDRCVESILAQTVTDLEIILVDDGSPDACPKMCDAWAEKDSRIRVVHKSNGGLSSARNAGIDIARGDYIGFVDSDDYILPDMYRRLLNAVLDNGADLAICGYAYVNQENGAIDEVETAKSPLKDEVLSREQAYEKINAFETGYSFYVTAWNKLYKRELFDNCRFPEGKLHEDEYSVHYFFQQCNKIAVISDALYMYIQRPNSIMSNGVSLRSLDAVEAMFDRYLFFRKEGQVTLAKAQLNAVFWKLYDLLPLLPEKQKEQISPYFHTVRKALIKCGNLRAVKLLAAWFNYLRR